MILDRTHMFQAQLPFGRSVFNITQLLLGLEEQKGASFIQRLLKRGK